MSFILYKNCSKSCQSLTVLCCYVLWWLAAKVVLPRCWIEMALACMIYFLYLCCISKARFGTLPASEFKPCTSRFCLEYWQDIWNSAANNKLHAIYPTVGKCIRINLVSRRDWVIINRLKIGHSRLTLSYFLERTNQHV